jgi:ketosteroid isomerase-like protein
VADAVELVRYAVERWNAGDTEAVFATWDPAIVMRPDPYFPDSAALVGVEAARGFYKDQLEFMGAGRLSIVEEHDLGERSLLRIRQEVQAPASGVRSTYEWSLLTTVREGRVVATDFFMDRDAGRRAAGVADGGD